ncbi:MAG: hypothetical protein OSW77_02730, partial [Proteobacteria bacterium]|nr:hypothetical protein [Pseudomonadota bacterium]
ISAAEFAALGLSGDETAVLTVVLRLQGRRDGVAQGPLERGRVSVQLGIDDNGNPVVLGYSADFDTYGQTALAGIGARAQPDVAAFIQAKLDEANAAGGGGGNVRVDHLAGTLGGSRPLARIGTTGPAAHGILAQSAGVNGIGGREGGGFWSFGFVEPSAGTPGGNGGVVSVNVDGEIHTGFTPAAGAVADASVGVFAFSQGGRGGDGGSGGFYYYGRAGATGGNGGDVSVRGSGTIGTEGRYGVGILAFSQGGNGGNGGGGDIFTGGGVGSSGGTSGTVEVIGRFDIETRGDEAHGIWAKSTGGRGGSGGNGGWLVGEPATGASASDAGDVRIASSGSVTTYGEHAYALFGQSVGGFGGDGGVGINLFSSQGGSGGSAGSGGDVTVVNEAGGTLTTWQTGSHALVAQSVGGGGGMGGASFGLIARGGIGAFGGNGGIVVATNDGRIDTHGPEARGIFAQSVGGGGGDGGAAVGLLAAGGEGGGIGGIGTGSSNGNDVIVTNRGAIETRQSDSAAIHAQSIGGGGGNGGAAAGWASVGGQGGSGGDAGSVTVNLSGSLITHGDASTALFAQSVGGGGGTGGAAIASGVFESYAFGGAGARGGVGRNVTVDSTAGEISTWGARSRGIFAQSVGGGGGDGGFAMAQASGMVAAVSLAVGGSAGAGGNAGEVRVSNAAAITTRQAESTGLFAQSVGGGGGNGGFAISEATGSLFFSASLGLGGSGADGGTGQLAWVDNSGRITTAGQGSIGLQAQSIGGGGGNGGFSLGISAGGLAALTMTMGGSAGTGGGSGEVHVENRGDIGTDGTDAHALFAQSVGGGGGNGGFSASVAGAIAGAGALSLGGAGGGGGNAGLVYVDNDGALVTRQAHSIGLFAQSVGGGGGSGGIAASATGALGAALSMALGGSGAGGGEAGVVEVHNNGGISTAGVGSTGLLAQSVGGGGGNGGAGLSFSAGGLAGLSAALGGSAADGGEGQQVTVENHGDIGTDGTQATALFAQSVGGGGGTGGLSVGIGAGGLVGGSIGLGGTGGKGGAGGTVAVTNSGRLATTSANAVGLFAQSVGGGGGNGGFAVTGTASGGVSVGVALGGSGNVGGEGKKVEVYNSGAITTRGVDSIGLQAQSVGGGGGNGGFSVAAGAGTLGALGVSLGGSGGAGGGSGEVHVENSAAIDTDGLSAHAMLVQSVGGGGGNGGFSIAAQKGGFGSGSVVLGGNGGGGGNAGIVYAENRSTLTTRQQQSVGLFAQSVGGGGGNGGFAVNLGVAEGASIGVTLGGAGAGGGDGNTVDVRNSGDIATLADQAIGLQAQSLGGGGGNGGFAVGIAGGGLGAINVALGGSAAGGGDGEKVDARNSAAIATRGVESHAMFVQSVGGGGGRGGFSIGLSGGGVAAGNVVFGGSGGAGGAGGEVYAENTGTLVTLKDKAVGLFAQSVGGGGGSGGFSIGVSGAGTGSLGFNLGGKGDTGGNGGVVGVLSHGDIGTRGTDAHGIFAQSLGGGGGNGGFAITASGAGTASATIGIGGFGAGGGIGERVEVDQAGGIETHGANAAGIYAQSVGGGGGNGGFSIGAGGAGTAGGTLTLGGFGGGGGQGGVVDVRSDGSLLTFGEKAYGLFAQSVGGGGGNGGFALAGAGAGTASASIGIGGFADKGGDADTVTVSSAGSITTWGAEAVGLFAQSVGGGGGNGGFAFAGSGGSKFSASVGVGGGGAGGGSGSTVHVDSASSIQTVGSAAHAIQAQSIGGGGGNGGMATTLGIGAFSGSGMDALVTVGGKGGKGGAGGAVVVGFERPQSGALSTFGDGAHGILAQSVGGGGGQGGAALGLSFETDAKLDKSAKTLTATFTFGGSGGDGNIGGKVDVDNAGAIRTQGAVSHGILAQSVGGGGGANGGAEAINLSTGGLMPWKGSDATNLGLEITAGGNAGNGNRGGRVTVINSGDIVTLGAASRGIFAQSVGGGGGAVNQGVTGEVGDWIDGVGNVLSGIDLAKSIYEAFKGDASGLVPSELKIKLGANEGSGADGDAVSVTNRAGVATRGLGSHAIFAQSVGAGGGDAKAYAEGEGGGESVETGVGLAGEFAIGGKGGAAGSGGRVDVDHAGSLLTLGVQAHGIYAQSVGGGGGTAGNAEGGFSGLDSIGLNVAFGQGGGSGGNGGAVSVKSSGAIETRGDRSIGLLAQSVGGGGGAASERSGLAFFGSVGGYGSGGAVSVSHEGSIVTFGERAHGIFAQSAGGLSGTVGSGDAASSYVGLGAAVGVTLRDGAIDALGLHADGILAQSVGDAGRGDVSVSVERALVRGGTGDAAGVRVLDGAANLIRNDGGWITTQAGIDGLAIAATGGDDTVRNAGLLSGRIDLGGGRNALVNEAGGRLDAGGTLLLGSGNTLTNQGMLSPLGLGRIGTTSLDGELVQEAGGVLAIDLDVMAGAADRLEASGSATLAGSVVLVAARPAPVNNRLVIVSAGDGVTASTLAVDSAPSAVAAYALVTEGHQVLLDYRIDFSDVAGLNGNQRRFGAHVNAIQAAGSTPGFEPVAEALFAQPDAASLGTAYDGLGSEPHVALGSGTLMSSLQFGDAMLSCRRAEGESRFVREGECGWLLAGGGSFKHKHSADGLGFDRSAAGLSAGFQREVAPDWHAGLAFGVEHAVLRSEGLSAARGDQVQAGAVLKWRRGESTVSAAVEVGRGSYAATRQAALPGGAWTASSKPRLSFAGAHLRLGHAFVLGYTYLRPSVDVG